MPLFPRREIPPELRHALIHGKVVYDSIGNILREITIMPAISKNAEFWNFTKDRQQTPKDNTCGFWSLFNMLMVLLQGNDTFMWKMFHLDSSEEETKFNAGCYLRWIFNKLTTQSPQETLENLTQCWNILEAGLRSNNYPTGDVSQEIEEIALTLAQAEAQNSKGEDGDLDNISIRDTTKLSPASSGSKKKSRRSQRSSKKKEKEVGVKLRKNKRKLDEFYQRNITSK